MAGLGNVEGESAGGGRHGLLFIHCHLDKKGGARIGVHAADLGETGADFLGTLKLGGGDIENHPLGASFLFGHDGNESEVFVRFKHYLAQATI
jgi:hypothetical protein